MKAKKIELIEVISCRLTENEKQDLEKIILNFKTTKSEFLRDWINKLITSLKNN